MASMGISDDVPFDLTILFFDDAFQWCEYLFDLFQAYDLTQNSERINDFPTNEVTLANIKRSSVQLVIISPQCVESCSTMIEKVTMSNSTIGLVCGTNEEDIKMLYLRIPSSRSWKLVGTDAKTIVAETIKMIKCPAEDDEHSIYVPMIPSTDVPSDQPDLYDVVDPDVLTYVDMVVKYNSSEEKVQIIPNTARCGRSEPVVLLFNDSRSIEGKEDFSVEFRKGNKKTVVPALKINLCTLRVETPKDLPAGPGQAIIYSNKMKLATIQFSFQSPMDILTDILSDVVNPIEFLCETLNITTVDRTNLDSYLSTLSKKIMETDRIRDVFGIDETSTQRQSDKEYPTILHFAAKFGLSDLCVAMMNMPCVVQALNLSNCHGKTPPDLAEESGFSDLNAVLKGYQDQDIYAPMHQQGPNPYVEMDRSKQGSPHYGNKLTDKGMMGYSTPFKIPIPNYRVEELVQGTPEDVVSLYDTLPTPQLKTEANLMTTSLETSIEKQNEENDEHHDYHHASLDPGQLELINLQNRVKRKEITVDEAVLIFKNLPSFITPVKSPDPLAMKKEIKKEKRKDGKKGPGRIRTRSQSSPLLVGSSNTLPNKAVETFRSYRSNTTPSVWHTAPPVTTKAKRSHSVNIITPSIYQVHRETLLDNLSSAAIAKARDNLSSVAITKARDMQKERAISCVENVRARADDGSPKMVIHDIQQLPDGKGDGSRPSSLASSRTSTCSRDSSVLNFDEEDDDSMYTTMQIPLPAIPSEEVDDGISKIPHREPPAIPSRSLPDDLPEGFAPPPPTAKQVRPTPAPRKAKIIE